MKRLFVSALAVLILGGCFGKPGPVEDYLRVGSDAPCQGHSSGKAVPVGVKRFACADALDRQSVMLSRGRVMSPSLRWYWEATPGALAEQAVVSGVNCSSGLAAVWPVRASSVTEYTVSGRVLSFMVREDARTVEAAIDLQLWDKDGKPVGSQETFTVSEPVTAIEGSAIADAGARVMKALAARTSSWIAAKALGSVAE